MAGYRKKYAAFLWRRPTAAANDTPLDRSRDTLQVAIGGDFLGSAGPPGTGSVQMFNDTTLPGQLSYTQMMGAGLALLDKMQRKSLNCRLEIWAYCQWYNDDGTPGVFTPHIGGGVTYNVDLPATVKVPFLMGQWDAPSAQIRHAISLGNKRPSGANAVVITYEDAGPDVPITDPNLVQAATGVVGEVA